VDLNAVYLAQAMLIGVGESVMGGQIDKLARDARGATAIEYGLIVALLVIVIISGVSALGGATGSLWSNMANKVINAG
jgi:pilus assembly protein Flp/PilA